MRRLALAMLLLAVSAEAAYNDAAYDDSAYDASEYRYGELRVERKVFADLYGDVGNEGDEADGGDEGDEGDQDEHSDEGDVDNSYSAAEAHVPEDDDNDLAGHDWANLHNIATGSPTVPPTPRPTTSPIFALAS